VRISIIIPSLNSLIIDQVLERIRSVDGSELINDIVVVGKDDPGLIRLSPPVRFIDTENRVTAAIARNLGIAATDADLFIFLDSDCLPVSSWLKEHIVVHAAGHKVVGGGVLPAGDNYWQLSYNLTLFHEFLSTAKAGSRDYLPGLNMSMDKEVIAQVGGMDETLHRVEDIDWTTRLRRAGYQPYFWPSAAVDHQHNRHNLKLVWEDCASSGARMRFVRLNHKDLLQAPGILRYPGLILWLSPFIAAWTTLKIVAKQPKVFLRFWHTLPVIYLTKIAWCWGASRSEGSYAIS